MKLYESIISDGRLSAGEKILLCYYVTRSIINEPENYNTEGFSLSRNAYLTDHAVYVPAQASTIAKDLKMDVRQVRRMRESLRAKGYIPATEEYGELLNFGIGDITRFFPIAKGADLNGHELIVYSYLLNASRKYGLIDKMHEDMAQMFGVHTTTLSRILTKLEGMGLIKREKREHSSFIWIRVLI